MQELQYLTFLISEELFGLGILYIKEIIEFESVTHTDDARVYTWCH